MKTNTIALWPAFVLLSGLVSCAPDNKQEKDVFTAKPPRLIKNNGELNIKDWDRAAVKNMDINDSLDVRESAASAVDIEAHCRKGDTDLFIKTKPNPAKPIPLFQLLSNDILTTDFNRDAVTCNFEIALKNKAGSQHIFNFNGAVLKDERRAQAFFMRNSEPIEQTRPRFTLNDLNGIKLRDIQGSQGHSSVICEDAKTHNMDHSVATDVASFAFNQMEIYSNRSADILHIRPLQLCRAAIVKDQLVQSITPVFELEFPRAALQVAEVWGYLRVHAPHGNILPFFKNERFDVVKYRITNPALGPRRLRISKTPQDTWYSIRGDKYHNPITYLYPNADPKLINSQEKHWIVTVPAKQSFELAVAVQWRGRLSCRGQEEYRPINIILSTATLLELSDLDLPLGNLTWDMGAVWMNSITPGDSKSGIRSQCEFSY